MISTTTPGPARIILRLCQHWGHRFPVTCDDAQGRIDLPRGLCLLTAGEGQWGVRLEGAPDADKARFEQVVAGHAQRMARGDRCICAWARSAA